MGELEQTLFNKYQIPVAHFDFKYINTTKDIKELERIVRVLQAHELGYFPDLTKCAIDKLRELKPRSKVLWSEEKLETKNCLTSNEWKEINDPIMEWTEDIKSKDKILSKIPENEKKIPIEIPPVRQTDEEINLEEKTPKNIEKPIINTKRIKSTDYENWDKFDADTEVLKMDLEEERRLEEIEIKNRINRNKIEEKPKLDLPSFDNSLLIEIEKEKIGMRYKERGNDYFRSGEYNEAITEYTNCLKIFEEAAIYNNRAMAYLKLKKYKKCIEDCNKCLVFEPKNIKALYRMGQAYLGLDKRRDAYEIFGKIIEIDPNNTAALDKVNDLKMQLPGLPPLSATRIQIEDIELGNEDSSQKSEKLKKIKDESKKIEKQQIIKSEKKNDVNRIKEIEEDLAQLVIPNKIIKNKITSAMDNLIKPSKMKNDKNQNHAEKFNDGMKLKTEFAKKSRPVIEEL